MSEKLPVWDFKRLVSRYGFAGIKKRYRRRQRRRFEI